MGQAGAAPQRGSFCPSPPLVLVLCLNFHCVLVFSDMAGDQLLIETEMAGVHQGQAGATLRVVATLPRIQGGGNSSSHSTWPHTS